MRKAFVSSAGRLCRPLPKAIYPLTVKINTDFVVVQRVAKKQTLSFKPGKVSSANPTAANNF